MRRLILDANLLVLLIVGRIDRSLIASHKRLRAYEERDYDLLVATTSGYGALIVTPNVLTETSNLLRQSSEPARSLFTAALADTVGEVDERYVPSGAVVLDIAYAILGLTDAAMLKIANDENVLLTADFQLYRLAQATGCEVINFTHLQAQAFDY